MSNHIQRFLFKELNIKGQILQANNAWQSMIADRHYPPALANLLGEVTLMAIMLANGLKHKGKITVQIQGQGPVNLLVVEATDELNIRGVAKTNQTITNETTLDALLGNGKILVTLDNDITGKLFQSYVPRTGETLSACFENYLSQSEQLPSKIWFGTTESAIGGVMIQKMPTTDQQDIDGWDRISHLSSTVKTEELCALLPEDLLKRLFVEEDIELYDARDIQYECPQDRSKMETMLKSLGKEEALRIIEQEGEIVIHNEICNFHERFNQEDIEALFSDTLH